MNRGDFYSISRSDLDSIDFSIVIREKIGFLGESIEKVAFFFFLLLLISWGSSAISRIEESMFVSQADPDY